MLVGVPRGYADRYEIPRTAIVDDRTENRISMGRSFTIR